MNPTKYFTKSILIEFNNAAIREKRNRSICDDYIERLPDKAIFPIIYYFHHTKDEIRVQIMTYPNGDTVFLDMSTERYDLLPTTKSDRSGNIVILSDEEIRENFPYNGREWTEKVIRSPYRNQKKFRNDVLSAYNYECAVCDEKEPSILRAAHIVPVVKGGIDDISNGICLCTNHEIAFDRGILQIDENGNIKSNNTIKLTRKKIKYPNNNNRPSPDFLRLKLDMYNDK